MKNLKFVGLLGLSLLVTAPTALAQNTNTTNNTGQTRTVSSGQKAKVRGIITERNGNMLTVKEDNGSVSQVMIGDNTSIKSKKWFGSGRSFAGEMLVRGLMMEAEGRGGQNGAVLADKIRFGEDDLRVAQSIETRVTPVEGRLTEAEANAQRLSGQLDELVAISNAARGGARAAQDTADAAVAGVNATNQRISDVDDYVVQTQQNVTFKVGSAVLSPEAKGQLDQLAQGVGSAKGFVIEITGYADATGSSEKNRALSERRANSVISYLVENHNIPLRRILPAYGFGELDTKAVADNTTREGRAQNRRVEVKLLVSRGLNQTVNVTNPTTQSQQPQEQ
ncbi:MAG TPA: OmpA family protein [Pyrinomonadaceae bacterium]|jgi:outer membrane protein OmpA-like peptidoglycan-associated protein